MAIKDQGATRIFRFFEQLRAPFPDEPVAQAPTNLFAFCRFYTRGMWPIIITISVLSAAIAMLEVVLFDFMGQLVDWFSTRNPNTFLIEERIHLLWMALILVLVLPSLVVMQSLFNFQGLMGNYPMRIRWFAHRYLLQQSLAYFQDEFAGRVATKMMQTALSIRETITKCLDLMVYIGVYFISIFVLLFATNWRLALPLVVWLVIYVIILRILLPRLSAIATAQADARSTMTGRIIDSYTNIMTVKLFAHSQTEEQYAKAGMDGFLQTVYPQMRLATWLYATVYLNNAILVLVMSALGIYLWVDAILSPGDIAIAISLALRLNGMSQWIMWEVSNIFEHLGTVQDGISALAQPVAVQDKKSASTLQVKQGAIDFHGVCFAYRTADGKQISVYEELDLAIKAGEKVGIVGRSGAGKSTLVNLLLRFYDIDGGHISIDGQDIAHVTQQSLRANIAMVTQDTALMHRSVRENIMYGRADASEQDFITACQQAQVMEFIDDLVDAQGRRGFAAHVGERGVKLSGGQRQRIALARVLLKNAPILILDEATSALDSEAEVGIQMGLDDVMQGKTVLAIAHRLSTIAQMDRLIVLDQGRIIESGSHQALLALDGIYARLWRHQTGGFLGLE